MLAESRLEEHAHLAREFREVYLASANTVASVFASLGSDRLPSLFRCAA